MDINELKQTLQGNKIEDQVLILTKSYPGKLIFTSSFGLEDQAITHILFSNDLPVEVATLDTGRLFPETYKVLNETIKRYQKEIKVYFPDRTTVENLMTEKGPFSFYESKENRIECCRIRKVEPLNRALEGKKVWISGIRADQSDNRKKMEWLEYDEDKMILKFYPLFNWSYEQVRDFIKQNNVPYNTLHDTGFVSIGCEPCTRAIKPGEDFRAGRWWWENDGPKECGCHIK
jgi:phosphoadenosine phosphosulfate reductase